jgi:hypothetical protein
MGGPVYRSQPEDKIYCLRMFVAFCVYKKIPGKYFK